jgi:hypothetical protein
MRGGLEMIRGTLAGALLICTLTSACTAERATGKAILIGAHLDEAKQASYYSLLQKDSIALLSRN